MKLENHIEKALRKKYNFQVSQIKKLVLPIDSASKNKKNDMLQNYFGCTGAEIYGGSENSSDLSVTSESTVFSDYYANVKRYGKISNYKTMFFCSMIKRAPTSKLFH